MRFLTMLGLVAVLAAPCFAQGHWQFAGPMSQFMMEGATPGVSTSGLPFSVVLADGGATISPGRFDLKGPGWAAAAGLSLDGLKFAGGHLTATVNLANTSGGALEGLRLDIVGATEEYKANDGLKTREQPVAIESPLLLGDLAKGQAADPQALDASKITFHPETTKITVTGKLSGLYYAGAITDDPRGSNPIELAVDSKGRLVIADYSTTALYRCDPDGGDMTVVAQLPGSAKGVAVNPLNGEIVGISFGHVVASRFTPGGDDAGQIPPTGRLDTDPAAGVRIDSAGNFYVMQFSFLTCWTDGKKVWEFDHAGTTNLAFDLRFDVDAQGRIWTASTTGGESVCVFGPKGVSVRRVATGPDWRLGRVTRPQGIRVDGQGNVYVIDGRRQEEFPRISEFDAAGHFVRVFGRGGKIPNLQSGALRGEGQIYDLADDLAFGLDGRVYVANSTQPDSVLEFRTF